MPKNSKGTNKRETALREIFRNMDPAKAQDIRESYYKAVEGLYALAAALEIEDLKTGQTADGVLIEEHLLAVQAIDAMKKSDLGRVL